MPDPIVPMSPSRTGPKSSPVLRSRTSRRVTRCVRWILQVVTVAALLTALAGGPRGSEGVAAMWQEGGTPEAGAGVPMAGVDPGRTNAHPGPGPLDTPEHIWNTFLGGGAHPPIVVENTIYVASDSESLEAVNRADGTERWRFPIAAGTDTPTYADGAIYLSLVTDSETGNSGGVLIALDATSGAERWRMPTGAFGGTSPVVVDGVVYAGGDQELFAFDAATGEELWRYGLDAEPCVCNPRPVAVADGLIYVVPGGMQQASLFAVDAATGTEVWRYDGQVEGHRFTDPVVANGRVYVSEGDMLLARGGRFVALDAASGEEIWTVDLDLSAPPAVHGDTLYVQARTRGSIPGTVRALDAATGEERWRVSAWDVSLEAPAVTDGLVLVPSGTREGYAPGYDDVLLTAYAAETGDVLWQIGLDGSISGSPAILDGQIYVTTYSEGVLFALGGSEDAAQVSGGTVDLSGRQPCAGVASDDPDTRRRTGTPVPAVTSPGQAKAGMTAADMPGGAPVTDEVLAEVNATLQGFADCMGGDPALLYGFFTDDFFVRTAESMAETGMAPNAEVAVTRFLPPFSPFADMSVTDARLLPDGRVAGFFAGGMNPIFVVFAEQDGAWLIDDMAAVASPDQSPLRPATPTP